jgi:hypothetical protein
MNVRPLHYPGDPPQELATMTRAEFNRAYPRPTLHDEEEAYAAGADFVVMPEGNEVVCDSCGEDVGGDQIFVLRLEPGRCGAGDRAYCRGCAEGYLLPYCG